MTPPRSARGGRAAKISRPAPENTLVNRLAASAQYRALELGYRVTGLKGFDMVEPHRGVGWFSLTRGCLVVVADGEVTKTDWYPTYTLGEVGWVDARARCRAA